MRPAPARPSPTHTPPTGTETTISKITAMTGTARRTHAAAAEPSRKGGAAKRAATPNAKSAAATPAPAVTVEQADRDDATAGRALTLVRLTAKAEVGVIDGWVHVWDGMREVRVGPFSVEQAQLLSDDLAYDAVAGG